LKAVGFVNTVINEALQGHDVFNQKGIDTLLINLDGTPNKSHLGANAILGTSLAVAKAAAIEADLSLYRYVGGVGAVTMPVPMMNILNGGSHADNKIDIQEFMVMPLGASSFSEGLRWGTEVFHHLKSVLKHRGMSTNVGDEGGFAPRVEKGNREALELLARAVERAGYVLGRDIAFGIDVAANELLDENGRYVLSSEDRSLDVQEMIDMYASLTGEFPLVSIEDGLGENEWPGWKALTERLGDETQLVGDDFLVTNVSFLKRAVEEKAGNAILIKVNQVGTLTETIDAIDTAHEAGWSAIVSHRSGETEDTTIAHLAVGCATGQIKTGSMSRTDRVAKYNELLRIEEALGDGAVFAQWKA
jgi:enolase